MLPQTQFVATLQFWSGTRFWCLHEKDVWSRCSSRLKSCSSSTTSTQSSNLSFSISWFGDGTWNLFAFSTDSLTLPSNVLEMDGQPENSETNVSGTTKHSLMRPKDFFACPCSSPKVLICESGRDQIGYISGRPWVLFAGSRLWCLQHWCLVVVAHRCHEGVDVLEVHLIDESGHYCEFHKYRILEITSIASHGSFPTTARIGDRAWNV